MRGLKKQLEYCGLITYRDIANCEYLHMKIEQRIGTYAFIQNESHEILVLKRADNDTHPGMWELPGGGVDVGEFPQHAVSREAHEETGLSVTPIIPFSIIVHESSKAKQVFRIVYLCELTQTDDSITLSTEHTEYQWMSIDAILTEAPSEFLVQITKDFQKLQNYA